MKSLSLQSERSNGEAKMKGYMFRDQVNVISGYFERWNDCEQLVFLYALLQKLTMTQSKFLKMVLQQSLNHFSDLQLVENEANDPNYIMSLCNQPKKYVVESILSHLPLLHSDNDNAKAQYMMLIPKVLQHSMENQVHIEECRHMLSYAIIHPAIVAEDRRTLAIWMQNLEETIKNIQNNHISSSSSEEIGANACNNWQNEDDYVASKLQAMYPSLQGLGSRSLPAGLGAQLSQAVHKPMEMLSGYDSSVCDITNDTKPFDRDSTQRPFLRRRSKSYSPIISSYIASNVQNGDNYNNISAEEEINYQNIQLNINQAPLSPQGSIASSGSIESGEEQKNSFDTEGSGMKDVLGWLKSLRLHKYSHLFANMTYDEMMNLSEQRLEKQNVTKGARHKIVLSIQKLKERPDTIRSLIKSINEGGNLRDALNEIKVLIQTPIKAYKSESLPQSSIPDDDLPSQLLNVMAKMCSQLLVSSSDDECFNMFVVLIEKCLSHEAFTPSQKRRLYTWKQQVQKVWHPLPPRRSLDNRINRNVLPHAANGTLTARRRLHASQPQRLSNVVSNKVSGLAIQPVITPQHIQIGSGGVKQSASMNEHVKPPSLNIQRRNSAPVRTNQPVSASTYKPTVPDVVDPEIDTRLRSLCLSMTEHALA